MTKISKFSKNNKRKKCASSAEKQRKEITCLGFHMFLLDFLRTLSVDSFFIYILFYNKDNPKKSELVLIPYNISNFALSLFSCTAQDVTGKIIERDKKNVSSDIQQRVILRGQVEEQSENLIGCWSSLAKYISEDRLFYVLLFTIKNKEINYSYLETEVDDQVFSPYKDIVPVYIKGTNDLMKFPQLSLKENILNAQDAELMKFLSFLVTRVRVSPSFFLFMVLSNHGYKDDTNIVCLSLNIDRSEIFYNSILNTIYEDYKIKYKKYPAVRSLHTDLKIESKLSLLKILSSYISKYKLATVNAFAHEMQYMQSYVFATNNDKKDTGIFLNSIAKCAKKFFVPRS